MAKIIHVDLDQIKDWYLNEGITAGQIAERLNLSETPIYTRLRKLGIVRSYREIHLGDYKVDINFDKLKNLYLEQKKDILRCAEYFKCSTTVIKRRLRDLKIKTKNYRIIPVPEDELRNLYCKEGLNIKQCAEHFAVSTSPIRKTLKRLEIKTRHNIHNGRSFFRPQNRPGMMNGNWRGGPIKRICEHCGKEFFTIQSQIDVGKGKYCSRKCADKSKQVEIICEICEKTFFTRKSRADKGAKYCSRRCHAKSETGERHVRWKGGYRERIKRRSADPRVRLRQAISGQMARSLRDGKKGRSWEMLVGYTLDDLYKRLTKTMPKDYTWNDYGGKRLHVDHRIPVSAFNFETVGDIDFKRCWALNNLRLLPAKENLSKYNKLLRPFQPSLKLRIST